MTIELKEGVDIFSDDREPDSLIWLEGRSAYFRVEPETANPYPHESLESEWWSDGWEDGQEDFKQMHSTRD